MDRDTFGARQWAVGTGKVFTNKPVRPFKFLSWAWDGKN